MECAHSENHVTCDELCACGHPCKLHNPDGCHHVSAPRSTGQSGAALLSALPAVCHCKGFLFPYNFAAVAGTGDGVQFVIPSKQEGVLTRGEAVVLAAWLVALAVDHDEYFAAALKRIRAVQ